MPLRSIPITELLHYYGLLSQELGSHFLLLRHLSTPKCSISLASHVPCIYAFLTNLSGSSEPLAVRQPSTDMDLGLISNIG